MDLERAGQLGSPLLATDMELLQVKPLRPFAAGEMCAFKEALTPAQAAAAAAHRRAGTTDGERCRLTPVQVLHPILHLREEQWDKCAALSSTAAASPDVI